MNATHIPERRMVENVAALYVDPRGPYPSLVRHWWDEDRDAKTYAGPWPVVAHPPCGPWSRLRFLCRHQDPECGYFAVASVRAYGGVLEHPAESTLWRACRLPFPGELPDEWGGYTIRVEQVAWGHACVKPTWLYVVGAPRAVVEAGVRTGGAPTHRITSGPRGPRLPSLSGRRRHLTPWAFAEWIISIASMCGGPA